MIGYLGFGLVLLTEGKVFLVGDHALVIQPGTDLRVFIKVEDGSSERNRNIWV